jgi:hypothetical protein
MDDLRQPLKGELAVAIGSKIFGTTISTADAADLLGSSPDLLQRERGSGSLPVEPLRLGRRLRWPTVLVAEAAGLPYRLIEVGAEDRS